MKSYIKKIVTFILVSSMVLGLTACGSGSSKAKAGDGKLHIVTTIFPEYDWVREIAGDKIGSIELTMLLDNGVDLHSFQPTAEDITKIKTCDIFIYVGGESDKWVDDVLKEASNKDMTVIDLLDVLGDSVREEEVVEGMQGEDEHEHGDEADHEDANADEHEDEKEDVNVDEASDEGNGPQGFKEIPQEEAEAIDGEGSMEDGLEQESDLHDADANEIEDASDDKHDDKEDSDHEEAEGHHHDDRDIEYDEHVWLSLRNAQVLVNEISSKMCEKDPGNADTYKKNAEDYCKKLSDLDAQYKETVENARIKTVLFADRFPFRYMVEDYGLDYYAAFVGCSAETEASFETVIFLAEKIDELSLPTICTIEKSDKKIAETVKENTKTKDQEIITMDSLQSVTSEDVKSGETYLKRMTDNLEALKKALGVTG